MRNKDSFLYLLGQLNTSKRRRIVMEADDENQLYAILEEKEGRKWRKIATAKLGFEIISQEDALPIVSRVEWDETTKQIQNKIPVKYLLKSQRPRNRTHEHGKRRGRMTDQKATQTFVEALKTGEEEPFGFMVAPED
jgi:hypothetical protein